MAMFSAIAARIMRSKSSQASSLLSHASQDPASIWASSSLQRRTNFSGSYSAQVGEHESRDGNSDQSTSFTCGKLLQEAASTVSSNRSLSGGNSRYNSLTMGAQRSMYTDVSAARVGRRPSGGEETQVFVATRQVDALQGIQEMAAGAGATAKMSIVLKSFEKIKPGRLQNVSKVGLPRTRILFTVNRSPHVDKKSREQFEMRVRKKLLVMEMDVAKLREKYNQLKLHNMLGVQLKVNFHYKTRLDMDRLKKPDVMEEASTTSNLNEVQDRKQLEAQK